MEGIVRNLVIILISGSLTPALICQESNWKIDPKVNLFYGYTGNNVTYEVKKFNSVKFTYRANQWRGPGIDSSKFIKREEYNGIVQTRDYFTWEPEISLRRQFWNKRMDVGLKFFYRMKKVDIQYYFQYPFDYKNPDFSTFENSTSANVHYFGFGLQFGYHFKRPDIWIRAGMEYEANNNSNNSSGYISTLLSSEGFEFKKVLDRSGYKFGIDLGNAFRNYNFEISKFFGPRLYGGLSVRFNAPGDEDISISELFSLFDTNKQELLQKGSIVIKDILFGLHFGYLLDL